MKSLKGSILLLITAFIWGIAFVAQSDGMNYVGPFTFNGVRSLIGGAVLLPAAVISYLRGRKNGVPFSAKKQIIAGVVCGLLLFTATSLQQIGIKYTSAGKAAFISSLYLIFVLIFGIIIGKKAGIFAWIGACVAAVGMYLLCVTGEFTVAVGDLLILACAAFFAVHILVIDHYAIGINVPMLACSQYLIAGVISLFPMFISENPQPSNILAAWLPLLFAGVMSLGIAYTLQIFGQRSTPPSLAALIMSLEAVFAALAAWVLLGETMSAREISGCLLMFAAILMTQLGGTVIAHLAARRKKHLYDA